MSKRRMAKGAFLGIWCSLAGVFATLSITMEVLGDNPSFRTLFDTYLGRGRPYVEQAEGSEKWDTDYYGQTFAQSERTFASPEAKENALLTAKEIADEGIILLKNEGDCLPLKTDREMTLLGKGSVDPAYYGTRLENALTKNFITPKKGLEKAGFQVDETADAFYREHVLVYPRFRPTLNDYDLTAFFIGEIPPEDFEFAAKAENVAVVFLTRFGAEGVDLSTDLVRDTKNPASIEAINQNINTREEASHYADGQHQLELSKEEKELLQWSKDNYVKTIVVLNSAAPIELGEIKDDPGIGAILQVGLPGEAGFESLGKILSGAVNPSGRTPDIYPRDFTLDPTFANFGYEGTPEYKNLEPFSIESGLNGQDSYFVQYEEGIYTGYRYYETRGSLEGETWYQNAVAYPFGYGLSYTSFSKSIAHHSVAQGVVSVGVRVTNLGQTPGKEVVQIYGRAPYSAGMCEKSSKILLGYGKTGLLKKSESETLSISFSLEDLASYDYKGEQAWVLDAGAYSFYVQNDSHEVALDQMDTPLSFEYILDSKRVLDKKKDDLVRTVNQFSDLNEMFHEASTTGYAHNFSRQDFQATFPTPTTEAEALADVVTIEGKTIAERLKRYVYQKEDEGTSGPTIGAKSELLVSSLRGADYDDSAYDRVLNQLTDADYNDAASYICNNAFAIKGITSIGLSDADIREGTQGFFGETLNENVCLYPSQTVLAATFNDDLATKMGRALGEESLAMQHRCLGWYGPSLDVHRSPFCGTYFEGYSEDPLLCGSMGKALVSAATNKGLICFVNHFALHHQESFKYSHLCVWANEQAIREVYLRPFEIVVKQAKASISYTGIAGSRHSRTIDAAMGVLSSSTYLGTTWASARADLLQNILREQWGFQGVVSSDVNLTNYMNPMQALLAGTDIEYAYASFKGMTLTDTTNPAVRNHIRRAIKNVVYLAVNSNAMQFVAPGSKVYYGISPWRVYFYVGEALFGAATIASVAWIIIRMKRVKKESELFEE